METSIPGTWKQAVCGILELGDAKRIRVTLQATKDWLATFPNAFMYELYDAIAGSLRKPEVLGREVTSMRESGTTYEFFFCYKSRKLYTKICLTPQNELVIIYSAHIPLKGDTL
jgi:hypothetical protein